MDRRQFIQGVGYGLLSLGLAGCSTGDRDPLSKLATETGAGVAEKTAITSPYDLSKLVVAQGNNPNQLMENGFKALGGIEALVKKDSSVVIKPNFSVPRTPEEAATTNPLLVGALVKMCLQAGAKEVKVIDFPFMSPPVCLENSGIKKAVEAAGGQAYTIHTIKSFTAANAGGQTLKTILFSKDVLDADVFINFPILKHHKITEVTMGIKNMMGLVWDRNFFHSTDLNQTIAELAAFRKPHLTILDATRGIIDNGPVGPGTIREWNQLVFGSDPVAVDAYGANLFGADPQKITYLKTAAKLGLGEIDSSKVQIVKV